METTEKISFQNLTEDNVSYLNYRDQIGNDTPKELIEKLDEYNINVNNQNSIIKHYFNTVIFQDIFNVHKYIKDFVKIIENRNNYIYGIVYKTIPKDFYKYFPIYADVFIISFSLSLMELYFMGNQIGKTINPMNLPLSLIIRFKPEFARNYTYELTTNIPSEYAKLPRI